MSNENVEVVKAAFAAWNRGDLNAWLETFHPKVEWHTSGAFPGYEPTYYGLSGVTNFWAQFHADWEEIFVDVEEIIDRGEQVIVLFRFRAKGRNGIQVQRPQAICDTMRHGRVVRAENFAGWDRALEAVGLWEQAMSQENVEVVRAGIEAWNAGDMDAVRELHDPDVVARAMEGWPEPGPFVGRDAVMRQFEQVRGAWDSDALELVSDFIDVGDRVAVRVVWRTIGHGPPEANAEITIVWTMLKGKILDIRYFRDHAEALEAVGLSE